MVSLLKMTSPPMGDPCDVHLTSEVVNTYVALTTIPPIGY